MTATPVRAAAATVLAMALALAQPAPAQDALPLAPALPGDAAWAPDLPAAPLPGGAFAGAPSPSSAMDYNAFLRRFDARELLQEMRGEMLGGAQAAVSNYLLALAYSSPAIASILDMADHKYAARYSALAQARATHPSAQGAAAGASRLARAEDQCLARAIANSESPTGAWRRCSVQRQITEADSPAAPSNADFLRRWARFGLPRDLEALLALLPDERVQGGALQQQAPRLALSTLAQRLQSRARAALARIDRGADAGAIAACDADPLLDAPDAGAGCLPRPALAIVAAGSWRASRLMPAAARSRFLDAFASQVALGATYDAVLELGRRVAGLEFLAGTDGEEARRRRGELGVQVARLLDEASLQARVAQERARLAQAQAAALALAESRLDGAARATRDAARGPAISGESALPLLAH
jgi:hypothetical protein